MMIVSASPFSLASVINYYSKWRHNLERHLWSSFMIEIYDHKTFIIQATGDAQYINAEHNDTRYDDVQNAETRHYDT
jgi:hypothetical protein